MKKYILFLILTICFFCDCSHSSNKQGQPTENIFSYAQNIVSRPGSDTVIVYYTNATSRDSIVYSISKIQSKKSSGIQSIAALSTTDIAMLAELGEIEKISGVCDHFRISNAAVQQRYAEGYIKNVGTSMEVNIELLVALNPDLVIASAFTNDDMQKYKQVQCPVVFTSSWQENSPLARVEWIKFLGMILGEQKKADSVFSAIEKKYLATKSLADNIAHKPVVLAGAASNDIWYMPGGESYIATFIADAGGDFIGKDNNNSGSVVLNFEQVLQLSEHADLWIGCDEKTYTELDASNKNYQLLSVYKKKEIYNRSKRCNTNGGNDYWEYGYVRPDIVLADYMKVIHSELLPDYETVFLEKVREE